MWEESNSHDLIPLAASMGGPMPFRAGVLRKTRLHALGNVMTSDDVKAMGLYAYEVAREQLALDGPPKRDESGWVRYRHCTRKVRHHDEPEVLTGWTHAYRCIYCEGYHITSKPRTGRNKNGPLPPSHGDTP